MIRKAIVCALAICLITNFSSAQDEEKKKKKGKRQGGRNIATQMMARFKNVGLNEEQQAKMKEIIKGYAGKIMEMRKEQFAAFSPEARKARQEAGKKARAEGLKGKALQEAIDKAAPIKEEVAAKMKEITKKMAGMQKEMREKLMAVLTDEQKAKLPKRGKKGGQNKKKKKKDEDKKDEDK